MHPFHQKPRLPVLLGRRLDAPFESKTRASPPRSSSPRRTTATQNPTFLVSTPFHPCVETSLRLSTTLRRFAKALERTRARRGTRASRREAPRIGPICGVVANNASVRVKTFQGAHLSRVERSNGDASASEEDVQKSLVLCAQPFSASDDVHIVRYGAHNARRGRQCASTLIFACERRSMGRCAGKGGAHRSVKRGEV